MKRGAIKSVNFLSDPGNPQPVPVQCFLIGIDFCSNKLLKMLICVSLSQ